MTVKILGQDDLITARQVTRFNQPFLRDINTERLYPMTAVEYIVEEDGEKEVLWQDTHSRYRKK